MIFQEYLKWHFSVFPKFLFNFYFNWLRFVFYYFSVPELFKNLFAHWHGIRYFYGKKFNLQKYIMVFLSNLILRIIGFAVRIIFIILSLLISVIWTLLFFLIFFFWIFLPAVIIGIIIFAFRFL